MGVDRSVDYGRSAFIKLQFFNPRRYAMGNDGNKKMKIKVKKATGEMVELKDDDGTPGVPVTQQELDQIYQSPEGFKFVGVMLHTHSSPGCFYIVSGGWAYKICW